MKEIIKKNWEYTLYQSDDNKLLLSVLCGTVALYDLVIQLNEEEKAKFEKDETEYLNNLAEDIRTNTSKYENRQVAITKVEN
ncbi:MAG: hypothetical protein M3405_11375 [Acidobacteriota bacterium]|jgi:hypothetical protein|nr:hypothetical protein [Acidobacteriota bacterium]